MNLVELQRKLLAAARRSPPSDQVPYLFEKRLMARLASTRPEDLWTLWAKPLWGGALACVAVAALLCFWPFGTDDPTTNLSQVYDSTVYAAADQLTELTDSW